MRNRTRISSLDAFGLRDQRNRVYPALEAGDGSTLSLDFTTMSSLDSRITFSRSSAATYVSNLPLNQNLVDYSETFDGWFIDGIPGTNETLEKNPNNSGFAYGFVESTSVSNHRFGRTGLVIGASQAVTISAYVKAGLRTLVTIGNNQVSNSTVTFQLTGNGSFGTLPANVTSAGISNVGNGWYRCHLVTLAKTDGTLTPIIYATTGTLSSPVLSYQGVDEDYALYVWGVQATIGTQLLPYLKTTTQSLSQGPIRFADHNMILRSEELDNTASWVSTIGGTGVTPVRTANNATAPDGTATADTITFNTAAGTTSSDFSLIAQTFTLGYTGVPITVSFWIRGTVGGEVILTRWSVANSNYTKITATPQWQRVSFTQTATSGGDVQIGVRQNISGHGTINASATVELWGVQVNHGSIPLGYKRTTNAVDHSTPRFDYDPTTLAPRGLLIEGSATNVCLQSTAVRSGPAWSTVSLTTQGPSILAPDGTNSGVEIVASNGIAGSSAYSTQSITAAALATCTFSVFLKPKGVAVDTNLILQARDGASVFLSNFVVGFNHSTYQVSIVSSGTWTATSSNVVPFGNGWYRVSMTGTTPATTASILMSIRNAQTGNGTDGVYAWGAQMEDSGAASSYIPTGSSNVQRASESCSFTGTNFSSWYNQTEGTLLAQILTGYSGGSPQSHLLCTLDSDVFKRLIFISHTFDTASCYDGSTVTTALGDVTGSISKIASAYTQSQKSICSNGGAVATGTVEPGYSTATSLLLGSSSTSESTYFLNLKFWPTRLSNAQMQSITQ